MKIDGWKYYNHAAIPCTAPFEEVNLEPITNGSIWKLDGKPILARWTTDWDCEKATNFWYVICERPFIQERLSRSSRKSIRKALENCDVRKINPSEYSEELWKVFQEATTRYSNYQNRTSKSDFISACNSASDSRDYWAGFDKQTNRMIGYKICEVYKTWVDFSVSKYSSKFLKLRVSDALNAVCLQYYLNEQNKEFVSNGTRSIHHETNVQAYYEEHFKFRKAFCKLHIKYRKSIKVLISILYPFRNILPDSDKLHSLVSLLKMEELTRG